MTKDDMSEMFRKSLMLSKHTSRPTTPAAPVRDEEMENKMSELNEHYNEDHAELLNFESRLSDIIDGLNRDVDGLNTNKLDKDALENFKRLIDVNGQKVGEQMEMKVQQFKVDNENLKQYVEGLEDSIKALAGKGGVTQDEFERSLVTATSKMEANLQVSERSATHSHLWPRTYKPV